MTHRVGTKGQVVIPKHLRERAGLQPGTEVEFTLEGERVMLTARPGGAKPGGRFGGSGMAARLLARRQREPR